jgi:glutathionylspermidine synthase
MLTALLSTSTSIPKPETPVNVLPALNAEIVNQIRRKMVMTCCKWDPQVGDVSTLAPFALWLRAEAWAQLAAWAQAMTQEAMAAEAELLARPALHGALGLPRAVRRTLRHCTRASPAAARTIRYDFHWTTRGWQISEANTDVPGGFTEASSFTQLMAEQYESFMPAGDPTAAWADAISRRCGELRTVALLTAPGFMEDQQIMAYLARHLRGLGIETCSADPRQLRWESGRASLDTSYYAGPVGAIVRFYQAEWIARLPRRIGWEYLFTGALTPIANPATSLLLESKRFPLIWDRLETSVSTWQKLLPETRDPRTAPRDDDAWILKTAICNTGDTVSSRALLDRKQWRAVQREIWWRPGSWIAQKRFDSIPIDTPLGPMHLCVGVYTVDGKAAGIYGRISPKPVIDFAAIDVAILIERPKGIA